MVIMNLSISVWCFHGMLVWAIRRTWTGLPRAFFCQGMYQLSSFFLGLAVKMSPSVPCQMSQVPRRRARFVLLLQLAVEPLLGIATSLHLATEPRLRCGLLTFRAPTVPNITP